MQFIGIDPGLKGSIAKIKATNIKILEVTIIPIPTYTEKVGRKTRTRYDVNKLADIFKGFPPGESFAILEKSSPMPGQGVVSMYSIGFGAGLYQGILAMQFIPFELIHSRTWQREFFLSGDTKSKSFQIASRLFPAVVLTTPRGRILDGAADALLLAEYGRRRKFGELGG